jgi:hypothetical protein
MDKHGAQLTLVIYQPLDILKLLIHGECKSIFFMFLSLT